MKKRKYFIIPIVALCITSNVYAITSNEVTYDNEGTTENLTDTLDALYSELKKYKTGGSVQANQMLEGATGYSKGELVTGTIKSKGEQTFTPKTTDQTIGAGVYLSGTQTIKGDANLVAGNIAAGKSIFGVTGTFTSDANAVAGNILKDKTAYVNGSKITGTIASKGAATFTPGTSNQTIASGQYLSGVQTIKGDANLVAGNIAKGKSIFGVTGTFTSDANATAAGILSGQTAYVNGSKVTGTMADRGLAQYGSWGCGSAGCGTGSDAYYAVNSLPTGYYHSDGNSWAPEARVNANVLRSELGVSANKIAVGQSIAGVAGTYEGTTESGKLKVVRAVTNAAAKSVQFTPSRTISQVVMGGTRYGGIFTAYIKDSSGNNVASASITNSADCEGGIGCLEQNIFTIVSCNLVKGQTYTLYLPGTGQSSLGQYAFVIYV